MNRILFDNMAYMGILANLLNTQDPNPNYGQEVVYLNTGTLELVIVGDPEIASSANNMTKEEYMADIESFINEDLAKDDRWMVLLPISDEEWDQVYRQWLAESEGYIKFMPLDALSFHERQDWNVKRRDYSHEKAEELINQYRNT